MHASVISEVTERKVRKENLYLFGKCDRFLILNEIRSSKWSETTSWEYGCSRERDKYAGEARLSSS